MEAVLAFFQDIREACPVLESIMQFITYFGEDTILIVLMSAVFWCVNKKTAYRVFYLYFVSGITIQGLKLIFKVPRPWVKYESIKVADSAAGAATGYSFPSGHTQAATSIYGGLAYFSRKTLQRVLLIICIALVMLSRMFLGAHTPLDVGVSCLVTTAIMSGILLMDKKTDFLEKHELATGIATSVLSIALIIYGQYLFTAGITPYSDCADAFKAAGAAIGFVVGRYIERRLIDFDVKCDKAWKHIIKMVIGLGLILIVKSGLKVILPKMLIMDAIRYCCIMLVGFAGYPFIIKKFFNK